MKTLASGSKIGLGFLSGLALLSCSPDKPEKAPRSSAKPNVLLIYTDDQGSIDMNCYGATDLITPNMDSLAHSGVRFTQFYAAAPVSSPSRAALLTGKTPQAAHLPDNVSSQRGNPGMPSSEETFAEIMKSAGYKTGHIGKWHLGYSPETMPNQQGFDYSFGHMGGCIDNFSHFFYWHGPNMHDLWRNGEEVWRDGEYFLDLMDEEVYNFLTTNRDTAFFLYWAINMPHYPLQPSQKWREKYKDMDAPRREYAAFVSTVDEYIGKALARLEELGLRENTIVIYQSDHGHSTEIRTWGGGGSAGPYRGAKFSLFEGGIRVPAIISWKGHLPENQVRDQMAINVDWLPTVAELCQIDISDRPIDGKSLVPVIESKEADSPHQTFCWQRNKQGAVRKGNWKLLLNPQDPTNKAELDPVKDAEFLVNLENDIGEMNNVASENPEIVAELKSIYEQWLETLPQKQEKK